MSNADLEWVRKPQATASELRAFLEAYALAYIEATNPGIDIEQVKRDRLASRDSWTARTPNGREEA